MTGWCRSAWLTAVAAATVVLASAGVAAAVDAPHVVGDTETDVCAICHRAHTAGSETSRTVFGSLEMTGNALLLGAYDDGDSGLCYACHGVAALGSGTDVETAFLSASSHALAPTASEYGPSQKYCSSCHDSHGTERTPSGDPYPALLRSTSVTETTLLHYTGNAYCASCHQDRPDDVWDGLGVFDMTAHSSEITEPASGTGIVCSVCHASHGSDNPPLIVEQVLPPAAESTTEVTPDARTLCFACHPVESATYPGAPAYATSGHAQSSVSVTPAAEWASEETTRAAGECQNCHNAMGESDGEGGVIAKLAVAQGRALCERCHSASGVATDTASMSFPTSSTTDAELFVTYDPEMLSSAYGRAAVYTQETTGTAPRDLVGPREFDVTGRAGDASAGDIDADGAVDVVVADPGAARLEVFAYDDLKGVANRTYAIDAGALWVAVADVIVDGTGRPEIAVVTREVAAPFASNLYLYRWSAGALSLVTGPVAVGNDASGMAAGDVIGTAASDLAITSSSDDQLRVLTESQATPGTLELGGPYATRNGPRGPSIGDAWDGGSAAREVVVANEFETTGTVSVFTGAGSVLGSYDATGTAGARAYDTLVYDVLPNVAGAETVVALRHDDSMSSINTFARVGGGGLGSRQDYDTGVRYRTSSLAAGDVDDDGEPELAVGNAGAFLRNADRKSPSVQVFDVNGAGSALVTPADTFWGGGTELAGGTPALVVADMGAVGESRHPVGAVEETHNSTETAVLVRHVECVDCHNVHEATSTPTVAAAAPPAAYGRLAGAWGVEVDNAPAGIITLTERRGVVNEYEVCMKCHSQWSDLEGGRDIAAEFDTRNASYHAVEAAAANAANTDGSFVTATPAWTKDSQLYCIDCHDNADPDEAGGPHTSASAPILANPLWGTLPSQADMLCFRCHDRDVYYTGTDDRIAASTSMFYDDLLAEPKLHKLHVSDRGLACATCHVSHGGTNEHLVRTDVDWVHGANGGACYTPCHLGSTANAYSRLAPEVGPASATVNIGTTISGTVADTQTQNGVYLQVQEVLGATGFDLRADFNGVAALPSSFKLFGRYQGNAGHNVNVEAWNWTTGTWSVLGRLPHATTDGAYTYPLDDPQHLSGSGQVRVRIIHTSGGANTHNLYLDRMWLRM